MKHRAILIFAGAVLFSHFCSAAETKKSDPRFVAEQLTRRVIYHSPQKPGYTCWVGAWQMPDKSFMISFKQATGPLQGRARSKELLQKMGFSPNEPARDYTGLELANVYLRSTNNGATWTKTAEDKFPGPIDRPVWGGSHCALRDGSILRAIDGSQVPLVDLPRQIFFQRSTDLGKTWQQLALPPELKRPDKNYLGDYGDCITRVCRVADGRLMATGKVRFDGDRLNGKALVMFSTDEGKSWSAQDIQLAGHQLDKNAWNEWMCAPLRNGDFLGVFRRSNPDNPVFEQVRWQGIFKQRGDKWTIEQYRPAPLKHSGHPDLLATREGPILHIATEGVHWTTDAGERWNALEFKGRTETYRSSYYPVSFQADDGRIYVFSHRGWDNGYGDVDQAIVMDSFRLARE